MSLDFKPTFAFLSRRVYAVRELQERRHDDVVNSA
jgi:hypothetical protein